MSLITVTKDGKTRLITDRQLADFKTAGYEVVEEDPTSGPVIQEDIRRAASTVLVELTKDNRSRLVEPVQVDNMIAAGWKHAEAADSKEVNDHEEHEGAEGGSGSEGVAPEPGEGRGGEGGEPEGDGAGSEAGPASDDEPSEGREGLTTEQQLAKVLSELDVEDDSLWTHHGSPRVDAVSRLVGFEVTKAQINEAAPGLTREG